MRSSFTSRLNLIRNQFKPLVQASHSRSFTASSKNKNMTKFDINSKLRMNSGYDIPILGYGVYQTPASQCEDLVTKAFDAGYRHVDSAAAYRNEGPCAVAVHKSSIPREDIFFTSKIPPRALSYENTKAQVTKTLMETGLDYIDLMLIHAPYGGRDARKGAWKALVEAQEEGKIRSLGVSNYGVHHLDEMEVYIKELEEERGKGRGGVIDVGQWELHPWLARADIVSWCEKRGIILEAYSPLVRGERHDSELLQPLVKKYNKTSAQILLRWSLQKGFVPLPKTVTPSRIKENADIYDFELTAEEMNGLETGDYYVCAWDPTVATLDQ
ncbi:hypothetical protein EAF00_008009 [Botryotinia globosa]|nr:hypothetical protein EAF00_008009 [Botryotinia globosa]